MGIVISLAMLATFGFIGWFFYRAIKGRQVKAHHVIYGITVVTGIFTCGFFLGMDIPQPFKILASIILGIVFIVVAAFLQRRQQPDKP